MNLNHNQIHTKNTNKSRLLVAGKHAFSLQIEAQHGTIQQRLDWHEAARVNHAGKKWRKGGIFRRTSLRHLGRGGGTRRRRRRGESAPAGEGGGGEGRGGREAQRACHVPDLIDDDIGVDVGAISTVERRVVRDVLEGLHLDQHEDARKLAAM